MKNIFLVQRLKANSTFDSTKGIYANYQLDYMGSAEFEFGALPKSLKIVMSSLNNTKTVKSIKNDKEECLRVYGTNDIINDSEYINQLELLSKTEYPIFPRTLENTYLYTNTQEINDSNRWSRVDIWWDVKNHVFFCFGKQTMKNLKIAINNVKLKNNSK